MGPPHLGQRGTNSVGTWPLCSAADNFFCHLQTRIDGVVAGAGTLHSKPVALNLIDFRRIEATQFKVTFSV